MMDSMIKIERIDNILLVVNLNVALVYLRSEHLIHLVLVICDLVYWGYHALDAWSLYNESVLVSLISHLVSILIEINCMLMHLLITHILINSRNNHVVMALISQIITNWLLAKVLVGMMCHMGVILPIIAWDYLIVKLSYKTIRYLGLIVITLKLLIRLQVHITISLLHNLRRRHNLLIKIVLDLIVEVKCLRIWKLIILAWYDLRLILILSQQIIFVLLGYVTLHLSMVAPINLVFINVFKIEEEKISYLNYYYIV